MKVNPSALKHGIGEEDVLHAASWAQWIEPLDDDWPHRELRLGSDTRSRLLKLPSPGPSPPATSFLSARHRGQHD